jgi:periplasmic protein TonB
MSAASMQSPQFGAQDPARKMVGWGVVVLVHGLVLWALVTGTARRGLEIIKKPLEAAVIQEVIIPPPPPPPKEIKPPEPKQPKVEAPPPPFVPPPEVTPPTTTAPTIASVQAPPPTPAVIAPPPPPVAAPVGRADIKVACPTQVRPEMPSRAAKEGIEGVVRAQVLIRDGAVVKVDILSGPQVFREPVREAMLRYRCVTSGDVIATQEFAFKFE